MPKKKQVELTFVADFAPHLNGREIVSVGVGPENEVLLLATTSTAKEKALGRYVQMGRASFPMSKIAPYRSDILQFAPDFQGEISIEVEEAHPFVQPLPNGEVLVVAARCLNRDGNPELNAAVYDWQGKLTRRFVMGDGLEHVAVARDGSIWAGYSDEGVFSNFGWSATSKNKQQQPPGASGIVRFDAHGHIVWQFDWSPMADCYTLNVARDAVWSCPYTNFPVVRITPNGKSRLWHNEISGARGLAIDNDRVLLFGGYQGNGTRCAIQQLGDAQMKNLREIEIVSPLEVNLSRAQVHNRGSILHFIVGTSWLQFDLAHHDV